MCISKPEKIVKINTTRWQNIAILKWKTKWNRSCTYLRGWLTFVLQCAVCEVLSKRLRCEPLPGPIPSILHWTRLLLLRRSHNAILVLLVWLRLLEFRLFMMRGQKWRDAWHLGGRGGPECVTIQVLRFM